MHPPTRQPVRIAVVQHRWRGSREATENELAEGIAAAAGLGARLVLLPELTLSRYPADTLPDGVPAEAAEDLDDGPTARFAADQSRRHGIHVHASVYRRDPATTGDGLGTNTAVLHAPDGTRVAATDKLHIPVTEGYYEDRYFRAAAPADPYPVTELGELSGLRLGMPTCWDEWFPELARLYSLAGAELLVYPTAIGSEPGFPGFDTEPLWRQVILGNGIANGLFMAVPNRWGDEGLVTFYGSSFVSDPFGRVLVRAPRDESAVLVADLDLDQRRDWLDLFPFLRTRRPDTYGALLRPAGDASVEDASAGENAVGEGAAGAAPAVDCDAEPAGAGR
ncbi:nitrilase-related carbon-nitrogen hydrolase [Tersicoccus sp. Bi-70]|uniref:nitrilase-related carbon-nitrogen hydrolase n=1 Tax=Tersicoccus sp. Bi-70 TaxID=1897634 RepID=UPI000977F40D|nr:nitrilase-related carbon-nitrogen hydrolase [Tersicoccus sp. Bi-70]OMH31326.1 hydrolase [Tersicoccus sp. Bi-70]